MDAIGQVDITVDKVSEKTGDSKKITPPPSPRRTSSLPLEDEDEEPPKDREPLDIGDRKPAGDQPEDREPVGDQPEDREPLNIAEPMEIDQNRSEEGEDEDDDDDLEALLGDSSNGASERTSRKKTNTSCCKSKRVGNIIILCQGCNDRTGYGVVGPHWFGPLVVLLLVAWASRHFVYQATLIGPISTGICILLMLGTIHYLLATSFKDPGIVVGRPPPSEDRLSEYRWCDFCNVYQPPDGAHCPDCNVCIAGYDHHCVWMGCCIGKGNHKSFVRFNLCWILYLLYSVLWVSVAGPMVVKHSGKL